MATTKGAVANSNDTVEPAPTITSADIERNVERVRGDIAALTKSLTQYGAAKSGEYKAKADKTGRELAQSAQDAIDTLTGELETLEKMLANRVREKPLQALGIAAGAGFLIAWLARR